MIQIDDKLISEELFSEEFVCNLSKCKGECCVEGDAGAPLDKSETKILEDIFSYANQLGQRAGAGAVYLNVFHSDINEFLDSKKINVDEKIRIKSLQHEVS